MSILHCDCRRLPVEDEGMVSWVDEVAGNGLGGIGVFCDEDARDESRWTSLVSMVQARSLRIGAIGSVEMDLFDLCCRGQERQEKAAAFFGRMIGLAEMASTGSERSMVVIGVIDVPVGLDRWGGYELRMNRLYQSVVSLAEQAYQKRIFLSIEHPAAGLFQSPLELREFVDTVGSAYFGVCFRPDFAAGLGQWRDWMGILTARILAMRIGGEAMDGCQEAYETDLGRGVLLHDNTLA